MANYNAKLNIQTETESYLCDYKGTYQTSSSTKTQVDDSDEFLTIATIGSS